MSTPAQIVLKRFDCRPRTFAALLAEHLGEPVDPSGIYKWTYPKDRGGTGGRIPTGRQEQILALAAARGVNLSADDLIPKALDIYS